MVSPTPNHPMLKERTVHTSTNSIASTPLACVLRAPFRGTITLLSAVSHGIFTTDCSIAVAIIPAVAGGTAPGGGTAVTGSPMVLTASNSAAGTSITMIPTAANFCNEGDLVMFTPSGSTGTTIGGTFGATFVPA
jgi:hypothetical protein